MNHAAKFAKGNAVTDGRQGWFVGHFIPATTGLPHQSALELKWYQHPRGEQRRGWAQTRTATTVSILVSGAFVTRLKLEGGVREITLSEPGDYIVFGPGVPHSWEALKDSIVISIRFPSVPSDQVELPDLQTI